MKKLFCIILLSLLLTTNVGQAQFNDTEPMFGQLLNLGHWSTDGLVFYWRGIPAGNAVDESYYGNHGTIIGPTWAGQGLYYNAATDVVTVTGKPVINQTRGTAIIWHTRDGTWDQYGTLLNVENLTNNSSHEVVWYWQGSDLEMKFHPNQDQNIGRYWLFGTSVAAVFPLNTPTCLAVTWDTSMLAGYRNGVPFGSDVGSGAWTSSAWVSSEQLTIGKSGGSDYAVRGTINHVIIYNRALNASEIVALYINPGLPMQQPPIWLFYSPTVGVVHRPAIGYGIGIGIGR